MTDNRNETPQPEDVLIEAVVEANARAAAAVYEFGGFTLEVGEQRVADVTER